MTGEFIGREGETKRTLPPLPPATGAAAPEDALVVGGRDWCFGASATICPQTGAIGTACNATLQAACLVGGLLLIGVLLTGLAIALVAG